MIESQVLVGVQGDAGWKPDLKNMVHWTITEQLGLCNSSWFHIKAIPVSWPICCLGFSGIFFNVDAQSVPRPCSENWSQIMANQFLTSFIVNVHPRTQKTSCFHFHHLVIELKPYIKRRFIDGAHWPTRCRNSAIRSCRFVIRWCLFLWGGQTQLKQHWTSNFERTITDKWNTTLLPCS